MIIYLFFFKLKKQDEHKLDLNKTFFYNKHELKSMYMFLRQSAVEGIEPKSHMDQHSTSCH